MKDIMKKSILDICKILACDDFRIVILKVREQLGEPLLHIPKHIHILTQENLSGPQIPIELLEEGKVCHHLVQSGEGGEHGYSV